MASLKDVDIELTQVEANDGDGRRRSEENEDDDQVVQENLAYKEGNDPPAHIAALSKNFDELKGLIKENPQCIYDEGISEQTVLHDAVESGDLEIVRFVLDTSENYPPIGDNFLNLRDVSDFTPLHLVAIHGSVEIAKLLIKHGASVNPKGATKKDFKTPFHKAAYYGKVELALYLLQQGAVISYQAFSDIIGGGYEKLAKAVIETDQWPLALRGTYKRHEKETTAFRELIAKMPDVAKMVLNRCTVEKLKCEPKSNRPVPNPSRDSEEYEVIFNYEFLEDYIGDWTADKTSSTVSAPVAGSASAPTSGDSVSVPVAVGSASAQTSGDSVSVPVAVGSASAQTSGDSVPLPVAVGSASAQTSGDSVSVAVSVEDDKQPQEPTYDKQTCDFDGINKRQDVNARPRIKPWGIETFSKADQPLQIMVNHNRIDLLTHPVVGSLIHYKWKWFGAWLYFLNLFTFCVFLAFLTAFVLILPNPQSCVCTGGRNQTVCAEHQRRSIIGTSIFVLFLAVIRLSFEIAQFATSLIKFCKNCKNGRTRCVHLLSYIVDWINWIEIAQYLCTIAFVIGIYVSENFCASSGLWQTGVATVFLGWTVLILFISKVPVVGIYVIILTRICITYLKMIVLTILMIVTFGLAFYLTFFDSRVMRSSFGDPAISLLKTITMSTGEVGFNSIFRLDSSGDSCEKDDIFFPTISYIVWILFIFFMPVVLINMLTSLAVDDTEKIRADAKLQTLTLQVEQVLSITEFFFRLKYCIKQKKSCIETIYYQNVKPNEVKNLCNQLLASFTFILWGGDHYDNIETILDVFNPPKNEVLERVIALENDTKDIKGYLQQVQQNQIALEKVLKNDIKDIKGYLQKILAKQENPL